MVSFLKKCVCITYILLICTNYVFTQSQTNVDEGDDANTTNIEETLIIGNEDNPALNIETFNIWNTIKTFLVFLLFIVVIATVVIFIKRLHNSPSNNVSEVINVVSSKGIAQGSTLNLIKIARGYILVAQTSQSMTLIKEFNEKDDIDEINVALSIAESESQNKKKRKSFYQKLQEKLSVLNLNTNNINIQHSNESLKAFEQPNDLFSMFRKGKRQ